jgi:hypothetical protein
VARVAWAHPRPAIPGFTHRGGEEEADEHEQDDADRAYRYFHDGQPIISGAA